MALITADLDRIWNEVLEIVRSELNTPSFKTWFANTAAVELSDGGVFVVGVQNEFARTWLEERYTQRLNSALRQVVGADITVRIVVSHELTFDAPVIEELPALPSDEEPKEAGSAARVSFNPKYSFDSFVVGDSNVFARNAALAVAEQPGLIYNPLFIWGGPGLGKTHLLHAIANYVSTNYPHKKVIYVTSEQFTTDFTDSINAKKIDSFRKKYRSVDVLLIDDVQFLQGKEGIQDQFFNTFNELQSRNKAVVLSSDRAPKDINMHERYQSRFAGGLQADIQPPNYETRLAILKQYVDSAGIPFDSDALAYVAERTTPNIREMEGAIIRIGAFINLSGRRDPVDLAMAQQVTRDLFPDRARRPIPIKSIQKEVCQYYNLSREDLIGSRRQQNIVYPRQIAMYLARELTELSLPKIGDEFGGRDHTTVMHAQAKIQKMMNAQREVYNEIQHLTNVLRHKY